MPVRQSIRFHTAADGTRIACAQSGEGPPLIKVANWLSHLEFEWGSPVWQHWLTELSRRFTLTRYDQRGCGLSDWSTPERVFKSLRDDSELSRLRERLAKCDSSSLRQALSRT